jgi:hypothetical protein
MKLPEFPLLPHYLATSGTSLILKLPLHSDLVVVIEAADREEEDNSHEKTAMVI